MLSLRLRRLVARAAVVASTLAMAGPSASCRKGPEGGKPLRRTKQRVFVIGFDGMDQTLARQYMDAGKLPNLKALSEEGVFARLGSTQPSESPTAWSSFATGVNPGKHSIYDFLVGWTSRSSAARSTAGSSARSSGRPSLAAERGRS